jgi:UDP-N-acetylglucosamine 2-epimerase (non-hydrolysing)
MLICNVVGARPNFMKMAPVIGALAERSLPQLLVHTGQHYDNAMSQVFFDELGMPRPDIFLNVGSDNQARQTAKIMTSFDAVCEERRPDLVIVAGDVNSTLACALVAAKRNIPVAHVEAGLRSFDRGMPEEINRVLTDHISDFLFTSEAGAETNLRSEGINAAKIHFVGNCMVDTLFKHRDAAVWREPWKKYGLEPGRYALVTLHRPSNVDEPQKLGQLLDVIARVAREIPVLFPVHPRTRERLKQLPAADAPALQFCDPLPYVDFVGLMAKARVALTDSGGIQEETTALGVPCLTLRRNTERPATLTHGTNRLVGDDPAAIFAGFEATMADASIASRQPPRWDGAAAPRIARVIADYFKARVV